jgi:hypothetical protein
MPRDIVSAGTSPEAPPRARLFERLFDEHSDGRFVKTLLITMLMIATVVQPFSLIYTAYNNHLPTNWWEWTPALATLLFVALDWTILPLAYFFGTTAKPALKVMLGIMLTVVTVGAFDGYFTATERMIAMRLEEITKHRLTVDGTIEVIEIAKQAQQEMRSQQDRDRAQSNLKADGLNKQISEKDKQIAQLMADQAADKAQHPKTMAEIKDGCLKIRDVCLVPKQTEELNRHKKAQEDFAKELATTRAARQQLNDQLAPLGTNDGAKVDVANTDVKAAEEAKKAAQQIFDVAVLNNQVYRWAGVLHGKSPRQVSADEANRVLMIFAATVAAGYVVAQVMLSVAFYGRHRKGLVESSKVNWSLAVRALRGYWLRKRRGVYRDRTKEVFVPTSERTRIVYVPITPGGPVPAAEEFVSKPGSKVSHG